MNKARQLRERVFCCHIGGVENLMIFHIHVISMILLYLEVDSKPFKRFAITSPVLKIKILINDVLRLTVNLRSAKSFLVDIVGLTFLCK